MSVWDGNAKDTTDCISEKFLQINSCGFQNALPDFTVIRKKGRCDYHILLMNSGRCEVRYGDKTYTLMPGNLVVYPPGEAQKYSFLTEGSSLWCHFTGTIVKELLDSCNIKGGVYCLRQSKAVLEAYSHMIQQFHQPGREKHANAALLQLIYHISDAANGADRQAQSDSISPILTYMNANYQKPITLAELAEKAGYSKSRFSHLFSEITGTTPKQYLNNVRLQVSCELLSTGLTVAEIADRCGFNDPLYYSRIFKKKYGLSPTEYRAAL